jgi:hypothetical protein
MSLAKLKSANAKTAKAVKRVATNASKTKKISRAENLYSDESESGWDSYSSRSAIRDTGIYETYSFTSRGDSWD